MRKKTLPSIILCMLLCGNVLIAQTNQLNYAGSTGTEVFNDAVQLSNGDMLVAGSAGDLTWINASVQKIQLVNAGITNNQGTNKYAFIIVFDSTLTIMKKVFHLPQGAAEDFRFIKLTNLTGQITGDIYVSGNTQGSGTTGGYFVGKLNSNFVFGNPSGFSWIKNIYAKAGSYPKIYQPWDVGSDGKVVYAYGDSHDYSWSAIYRLKSDGSDDVVPNWRLHYTSTGTQYLGNANNYPGGISGISYSAIVFKRDGGRCELRSPNATDYNTILPDGNGGTKKGKWPLDVLFNTHCVPGGSNTVNGPGYTGYSPSAIATFGPSSICIDRRNNHFYIGLNMQSRLPGGEPDFEPAVMAMDESGTLKWWSRLYHEITPAGAMVNSSPDQYVDALAVDYSRPVASGYLVVGARAHGNNIENLWEGNRIAANPTANGFQNNFTGSGGNFHLSWIGKLTLQEGTLMHSTYMAELAEGATGLGSPSTIPLMDGWPSPNSGWPTLNTTYLGKNNLKVTADGSVLVLGVGRRTITTSNAYQKMIKPAEGKSSWNQFVRLYTPDLSALKYSSLVSGTWDAVTGSGADNVRLYGVLKTSNGIIALGQHTGSGNQMPVINVPGWGNAVYADSSAVAAYYQTSNMYDANDNAYVTTILPVSLVKFTGHTSNGKHHLNWQTATETNNKGFYIQKSLDGFNYQEIDFVHSIAANGNSHSLLSYTYTDEEPAAGNSYYRLRQVDADGRSALSDWVRLSIKNTNSSAVLSVYPNPVKDQLVLNINDPIGNRNMSVAVYDYTGRKLIAFSQNMVKGLNVLTLNASKLAAGSYQVRVFCETGCEMTERIIKK